MIKAANRLISVVFFLLASTSFAGQLTLRLGPPSLGNGGTNPVGLPPGIQDVDITYLTKNNFEMNFSIVPGLLFGKRAVHESGFYMSLGGGLIISANGSGLGPYAGFGWESSGKTFKFNAEFKQSAGVTAAGIVTPYALRLGMTYNFDG